MKKKVTQSRLTFLKRISASQKGIQKKNDKDIQIRLNYKIERAEKNPPEEILKIPEAETLWIQNWIWYFLFFHSISEITKLGDPKLKWSWINQSYKNCIMWRLALVSRSNVFAKLLLIFQINYLGLWPLVLAKVTSTKTRRIDKLWPTSPVWQKQAETEKYIKLTGSTFNYSNWPWRLFTYTFHPFSCWHFHRAGKNNIVVTKVIWQPR